MIEILEASGSTLVIDLDTGLTSSYTMTIVSTTDSGCIIPWNIINRNPEIDYETSEGNMLTLFFDVPEIKDEKIVYVVNTRNESATIKVMPNIWESMDKEYRFSVDTKSARKGNVYLRFISTEEGIDCPWYLDTSGQTVGYDISPVSGMSGDRVDIKTTSTINGEITEKITFRQERSGLCLNVFISHSDDKVKIQDIVEGC